MVTQTLRLNHWLFFISATFFGLKPCLLESKPKEHPQKLLAQSINLYGNLHSYSCQGKLAEYKWNDDVGLNHELGMGGRPDSIREGEFNFVYSNGRILNLRIAFYKKPGRYKPDQPPLKEIEILSNSKNQYEFRSDGNIEFTTESLDEMIIRSGKNSKWLLNIFLDLLEPSNHYKCLSEVPQHSGYSKVNGINHVRIRLKSTTTKTIWIDPTIKAIDKIRYLYNRKSINNETKLLRQRIAELEDDQVDQGNQIVQEIDALADRPDMSALYVYELTHQTFD